MPTFDFNLDFNLDFNVGTPGASVGGNGTRLRFNTEDYRKYVGLSANLVPGTASAMRFPAYWDAELRACEYLNEFMIDTSLNAPNVPGFEGWRASLQAALGTSGLPPTLTSPHTLPTNQLQNELLDLLDRAPDRPDRFHEIVSQHTGEGAIGYYLGMLMIDPGRMPATHLLIRVARRIGEHVAMCLKGEFRCPRPSQLCSAIVPMIDPPATPSFPSGHSLQAALIARCLEATSPPHLPAGHLDILARRIGENRIIAGLHYRQDDVIGYAVGRWIFTGLLSTLPATSRFGKLLTAAIAEMRNDGADEPA
jgi:acid phosphatase (class A)